MYSKPKLYALLIGIANYADEITLANNSVRFPKLSGCVQDAEKIKNYLEQDNYYESDIKLLADDQASKKEIVKWFIAHLGKSKENDVALFYFSGHGTQEHTDKTIFSSETDGKLESLVCYYNTQTKDDFLLADKELRWLINQVAINHAHVVTIFDCCHSADITRNGELVKKSFEKTIEKRIPFVFPQRDRSQFIFSEFISLENIAQQSEFKALPEGLNIQFSACESNESAVEVAGEGVFTKALLKVLKVTEGNISYYNLNSRIRQYLRSVYEQKPRIYVTNNDQALLHATFLNKPIKENNISFGEVTYNEQIGWQINLGAIHGITKSLDSLKVYDPENKEKTYMVRLGDIKIDSSQLLIDASLDKEKSYRAYVEDLMAQVINVHIAESNSILKDQERLIDKLLKVDSANIVFKEKEKDTQYVIRFMNGKYYITYSGDPYRPLSMPIEADSISCAAVLANELKHISQWQFVKNIKNPEGNATLADNSVSIEIAVGDNDYVPVQNNEKVVVKFFKSNGQWVNTIKIKLTNNTNTSLYCCALYLVSNFQSCAPFLNPPVYLLEKNNSVELNIAGSSDIPISLDPLMKWYNLKHQIDHFKFIISKDIFDIEALILDALPPPQLPNLTATRSQSEFEKSGIGQSATINMEKVSGWFTKDISIELQNPEYNIISEADLRSMIENENTTDFALGLYYDGIVNENFQTSFILKQSIQIKGREDEILQRGLLQDKVIDIANWWARKQRNKLFEKTITRFPDRIRIVSEGDSWFQHPLVLDIIDHLSRTYAIYCTAAAGDTLRNYFSNEKVDGEYYLDAIAEKHPSFFLISGGGNDILGSQFKNYLSGIPENALSEQGSPKRFLKQSIFDEIDSLMDIYRTLFGHLEIHNPDLHIIVHGYDYPVKLDEINKGWLGRYMIEKGIKSPENRKDVIHCILDNFNNKLETVSAEFDNVSYLDVRNLVRFNKAEGIDQWYDEIHPNNDGFQQIAMKFIQKIDSVIKKKETINTAIVKHLPCNN